MIFVAHGLCQPSARVTSPAVCDLGKTQIPLFTVRQGCAVKCRSGLPTHQIPLPALQPWPPVRARLGNRQNQPPIPQFRSPAAAQPFCSSATVPQKEHLPGRAEADALRSCTFDRLQSWLKSFHFACGSSSTAFACMLVPMPSIAGLKSRTATIG